eukprot:12744567-Prorocentrum_lima.AAC.1
MAGGIWWQPTAAIVIAEPDPGLTKGVHAFWWVFRNTNTSCCVPEWLPCGTPVPVHLFFVFTEQ